MNKFVNIFFLKIYKYIPEKIKKTFAKNICRIQGGEPFSTLIRKIWKEYYYVEFGIGSYGILNNYFVGTKDANIKIGNYCSIASGVSRFSANHPMEWACMNPLFYEKKFGYCDMKLERAPITIGNDVWIAHNVSLLKGCTQIGNGAIIASGSVVTKDIPPYEIWGGVPAHFIKKRFTEEEIELLEASKWWELEIDKLVSLQKYVSNPIDFARETISLGEK